MRESGTRKRDEGDDDDGDVDEDDHPGDDSPPDGTPAPPRERRRGSPPCASSSMASPLDGERSPLWSLAFMVIMALPGSSSIASSDDGPLRQGAREGLLISRGYRGLRRLNFRSRLFSGGLGIYSRCWHREQVRGPTGSPGGTGARPGGWARPHPCGAHGTPLR